MRWAGWLLVGACAGAAADGEVDDGPGDTEVDDTGVPDTDDADGTCSEARPDGPCPGARICVEGACVLDVDPGVAPPDVEARLDVWERIADAVEDNYAAFAAKPRLSWTAVRRRVARELPRVDTELGWIAAMSRGVAEIGDGHTYLVDPRCSSLPLPARGFSNTGLCFVEGEGGAILANVVSELAEMDVRPGDRLLAVDGRPVERVIDDLGAQPSCLYVGSSPAMTRADRVQTLGWREAEEDFVRVQRVDGTIDDVPVVLATRALRCDGRVPPPVEDRGGGLSWARLEGDVGYVHFPFFGSYDAEGAFLEEPLRGALRELLSENRDLDGLVLDLRANGGGYPSIYFDLASWVFDEPTTLFYGGLRDQAPEPLVVEPDDTLQLRMPIAVLVSPRSFSAADFCSAFLGATGRARTFGRPSGGGFGSSGVFTFDPSVLGVNTYQAFDLDLRPLEGNPPPVDVPLRPRAEDLAAGRDTELDAAVAWLATQQ